ncbi:MAG: PTO1314 family radical SAM protein [Ferroplasma sp.]
MSVYKAVVLRSIKRNMSRVRNPKLPTIAGHKLLYECNLRCKMCPFWRRQDESLLDLRQEILMMDKLVEGGVSYLGFEGGEPLLRHDIADILMESHKRFHTSMVTNGWLLDKKIDSIAKYLDFLFVSIDGRKEIHDNMRGVSGSYEHAIRSIKKAHNYVPLAMSSTITRDNISNVSDFIDIANQNDISVNFQIEYDYSTAEKISPDKDKLLDAINYLIDQKKSGMQIMNTLEYFESIKKSWFEGIKWECRPWLTINIDPQGRVVTPCYIINEYSGSNYIWDIDIKKAWNSYNWEPYRSCNKCALACYLEPSLFKWRSPAMVKSRIIDATIDYIKFSSKKAI